MAKRLTTKIEIAMISPSRREPSAFVCWMSRNGRFFAERAGERRDAGLRRATAVAGLTGRPQRHAGEHCATGDFDRVLVRLHVMLAW